MKKSKIFIGPVNIANMAYTLNSALNEINIRSDHYMWALDLNNFHFPKNKNLFLFKQIPRICGKNITHIVNHLLKILYLLFLTIKYNEFIFISPHTLLPKNYDLKILRLLKKKIVIIFAGCYERQLDFSPNNPEYICNRCVDVPKQLFCSCNNIEIKKSRVQYFEKYASYIVSQDDSAGYLASKKPIWLNVIADYPSKLNYLNKYKSETITIVHFPSNPLIKLSGIIIPILERIAIEENNVNLIIEEKIPHSLVLKKLEDAHILVDALGLSYGVLAVEAMARGCVVACGEMEFIKNNFAINPLIHANSLDLYDKLKYLIKHKMELEELAMKSIEFYHQYHSPIAAAKYYKNKLRLL